MIPSPVILRRNAPLSARPYRVRCVRQRQSCARRNLSV